MKNTKQAVIDLTAFSVKHRDPLAFSDISSITSKKVFRRAAFAFAAFVIDNNASDSYGWISYAYDYWHGCCAVFEYVEQY